MAGAKVGERPKRRDYGLKDVVGKVSRGSRRRDHLPREVKVID